MAIIRIKGIQPWDGDYEFDISYFTNRELKLIKDIAGIRAGELAEEFSRGNNDLIVAVAVIAMKRNNANVSVDDLWDAAVGNIELDANDEEDDADPPTSPPSSEHNGSGQDKPAVEPTGPLSSPTGDAPPEKNPLSIGSLGSETTAA